MPKDITSFFEKKETSADKRKAALAKRKELLEKLNISSVTDDIKKTNRTQKKKKEEGVVYTGPIRKSRRLKGEAPEIMPDEFYMREVKPFIPQPSEKDILMEKEGSISYDGDFDASQLAITGDLSSFFTESIKTESTTDFVNVEEWTSSIQFSGAKKVVPGRIYSMCIHPRSDKLMMAAGDKEGHLAFWSLPSRIEAESLPQLENGMRDISELGECCQFKLSHEPITRLFYGESQNELFCCSYDKTIKRFDINIMKFQTLFKLNSDFDSDLFIHHCIPVPDQTSSFYVSLSNGEIITIDTRDSSIQACFQAHAKKVNTIDIHNSLMCTASLGRSVRLWDIRALPTQYEKHHHCHVKDAECEKFIYDYVHPLSVNSAFFNQTGDMIVTTCQDNHLRVFNTVGEEEKANTVLIQHRNQTGKWLTKLMAEWYFQPVMPVKRESSKNGPVNYFHCGSMDEPRQINLYSVVLVDNARPIVKTLPSIFSPHIASIQSLVKMHTSFPLIACGNTSGRIVALMNNQKSPVF